MTTDDTRAAEMAAAFKPLAEMGNMSEANRETSERYRATSDIRAGMDPDYYDSCVRNWPGAYDAAVKIIVSLRNKIVALEQFEKSVAANLRAGGLTSAADCVERAIAPAKSEQITVKEENAMQVTDEMVDRFLSWPLPKSVRADTCVTTPDYPHERNGTNFLTATEARQMLEYVLQPSVSIAPPAKPFIAAWNGRPFELKEGDRWSYSTGFCHYLIENGKVVVVSRGGKFVGEPKDTAPLAKSISADPSFRPCDASGVRVPEWIVVKEGERWRNDNFHNYVVKPDGVFYEGPHGLRRICGRIALEDCANADRGHWKRIDPPQAKPDEPEERWNTDIEKFNSHYRIQEGKVFLIHDGKDWPVLITPEQLRNDKRYFRCDKEGKRLQPSEPKPMTAGERAVKHSIGIGSVDETTSRLTFNGRTFFVSEEFRASLFSFLPAIIEESRAKAAAEAVAEKDREISELKNRIAEGIAVIQEVKKSVAGLTAKTEKDKNAAVELAAKAERERIAALCEGNCDYWTARVIRESGAK